MCQLALKCCILGAVFKRYPRLWLITAPSIRHPSQQSVLLARPRSPLHKFICVVLHNVLPCVLLPPSFSFAVSKLTVRRVWWFGSSCPVLCNTWEFLLLSKIGGESWQIKRGYDGFPLDMYWDNITATVCPFHQHVKLIHHVPLAKQQRRIPGMQTANYKMLRASEMKWFTITFWTNGKSFSHFTMVVL